VARAAKAASAHLKQSALVVKSQLCNVAVTKQRLRTPYLDPVAHAALVLLGPVPAIVLASKTLPPQAPFALAELDLLMVAPARRHPMVDCSRPRPTSPLRHKYLAFLWHDFSISSLVILSRTMEFPAALAFLGYYFWESLLGLIVLLSIGYLSSRYLQVTFLCVKAFFLAPRYHITLFATVLCHFAQELHLNSFIPTHWHPEKVLAMAEKEQKKIDKPIENNIWEGESHPENRDRRSSVDRTVEEMLARKKNSSGIVESVVQPGNSMGKAKGKKCKNKK